MIVIKSINIVINRLYIYYYPEIVCIYEFILYKA